MARVSLNRNAALADREQILFSRYGGFMSIANIMSELGCSRNTAVKFASSLPSCAPTGKSVFDIRDVARKIESTRTPPRGEEK